MAIKIQLASKPIEVDINGLMYSIPRNDELFLKVDKTYKEIMKKSVDMDKSDEGSLDTQDSVEQMRALMKQAFDVMLQKDGAFEEIEHSLAGDNERYTMAMTQVLQQLYLEFEKEMVNDNGRYHKLDA